MSNLGTEAVETISYWEEGLGYGYSLHDNPNIPLTEHLAVLQVETDSNGGSLVTYRQYFEPEDSIMTSISVRATLRI